MQYYTLISATGDIMAKAVRITSGKYEGLHGILSAGSIAVRVPDSWNSEDRWHDLNADKVCYETVSFDRDHLCGESK